MEIVRLLFMVTDSNLSLTYHQNMPQEALRCPTPQNILLLRFDVIIGNTFDVTELSYDN